ncbi:MAG TPA: prolyl oligopeptidase family serine peptidase [Bryobacteraceae bacterium]|nr:prolyl oligopeptidase family serine peptidase [Bryobacteraceae bacterium]
MKKCVLSAFILAAIASAQPAAQLIPRRIPPLGVTVPPADREALEAAVRRLSASIDQLHGNPLLPDVLIYREAVRYALEYNEFFKSDEIAKARALLQEGQQRADELAQGRAPWTTATGLVVRGYISKIDRSVQPYGLVVPPSYSPHAPHRYRLDAWFHGRSETLSEVNFLNDRERNPGEFQPTDTIVLHLYGRYCNASKFAGEVDFLEALDAVKHAYPIDENRILVRGFSMGGASVWHIAAHYAGLWAAAQPGAGFSETPRYLKLNLNGPDAPSWFVQKLWHLYNATDYAANFFDCPLIAYNGGIDPQRQAADMMEAAMAEEGLRLFRIVGPNTAHKYHPDSKIEIERRLDTIAARGRDPYPPHLRFTTWTLAYNRMKWITVDALAHHWERARLDADITGTNAVAVKTANVTAFTLDMGPGGCPLDVARHPVVTIDGQPVSAPIPFSDRSWSVHFRREGNRWGISQAAGFAGLHKRHGLQGPVDDAFLSSFIFVSPTGKPFSAATGEWVASEERRAIAQWRSQFRGEAQVRDDSAITDADIASSNLVLWGDPSSNKLLAHIVSRLPVKWSTNGITVGSASYPAASDVPILIYPNPLNPNKYVVLNSGFTFREFDYMTNARQTPKLPDYAIIDTTTAPDDHHPGKIVLAGFFNEDWRL